MKCDHYQTVPKRVADAAFIALGFFLPPIPSWPIMLAVYIGLLSQIFDLEVGEAIMLAVITYIIEIIAAFVMAMTFLQ